jgi:acyl carrier protein
MNNTEETIKKIMAKSFLVKLDRLTDDAHLINDLEADSLGVFEMVINLEDEFGIEFKDRELLKFETVGEAVKVLTQLIEKERA